MEKSFFDRNIIFSTFYDFLQFFTILIKTLLKKVKKFLTKVKFNKNNRNKKQTSRKSIFQEKNEINYVQELNSIKQETVKDFQQVELFKL